MRSKAEDGYRFAVDCAIACAGDKAAVEFYRGMASGLCLWADAVPIAQHEADAKRIQEAQRCAMTKMTEEV